MTDPERVVTGNLLTRGAGGAADHGPDPTHGAEHPHLDRPRLDHLPLDHLQDVLRRIPSHGWPAGWLGRRDRALLVLFGPAGLSFEQIAGLTAGEVRIADGVATIAVAGRSKRIHRDEDDLLCGPCALARWIHALDLTIVYPDGRVIAAVIGRAMPLTSDSPHLCHSNNTITEVTRRVPILPPIDRWGHASCAGVPRTVNSTRVAVSRPRLPTQRLPAPEAAGSTQSAADRARGLERRVGQLLDPGHAG